MALKLKYFSQRDHRYSKIYQEAREFMVTNTKQKIISLASEFATHTGNTTSEWQEYLSTLACKYETFELYVNAYHDLEDLRKTGKMSRLLIYDRRMQIVSEILNTLNF